MVMDHVPVSPPEKKGAAVEEGESKRLTVWLFILIILATACRTQDIPTKQTTAEAGGAEVQSSQLSIKREVYGIFFKKKILT